MRLSPRLSRFASRLVRDERGQIAVTFGLLLLPVLGLGGAALDYSRATTLQSRIQAAIDATVLLTVKQQGKTEAELKDFARKTFTAYVNDPNAKLDDLLINASRTELTGKASATSPNTLAQLIGVASLRVEAEARAVINNSTYEIALVLDNSGSMAQSASGGSKLYFAQDAAKRLVDAMLAPGSLSASRTKISVVPFSLAVQVGSGYANAPWVDNNSRDGNHSSIHWQNVTPTGSGSGSGSAPKSRFDLFSWLNVSWRGCFETRPGAFATNDAPATPGANDSYFVPMFAPDEPGDAGASSTRIRYNGQENTAYYFNSYVDDNPNNTCKGSDKSGIDEYGEAQSKVCKYRDRPAVATAGGRGPNYMCNSGPLLRLTETSSTLQASIRGMVADGSTNLLEGFMWGWRAISPSAPFGDGRPYGTTNNRKIIILMTDGINSWSGFSSAYAAYNHNYSQYSPFGYYANARLGPAPTDPDGARRQIDAKTLEACANFKAKNTIAAANGDPDAIIYTVGFSTPQNPIDAQGLTLLRDCATPQTDADKAKNRRYAFVATTGDEIVAVFEEIAASIGGLRLAR